MSTLAEYVDKYKTVRMERQDGILLMRLHRNGGPLVWGKTPYDELPNVFHDISLDPENRIVILTGTGDAFTQLPSRQDPVASSPGDWDFVYWHTQRLLMGLLNIEVPVIAAVNGPSVVHSELPLLCDIVLASENAAFQDAAHLPHDTVPGDGVHVVFPLLLGWNRGRHFLLTGRSIPAGEAQSLGLVAEVVPSDELLARAQSIAGELTQRSTLTLRYTRAVFVQQLKRLLFENLGFGLALEGLAAADQHARR